MIIFNEIQWKIHEKPIKKMIEKVKNTIFINLFRKINKN
jgi:hypothetical protein